MEMHREVAWEVETWRQVAGSRDQEREMVLLET